MAEGKMDLGSDDLQRQLLEYMQAQKEGEELRAAIVKALLAMAATIGECRMSAPFAPLRPIIGSNGKLKWCCTHTPEHCASRAPPLCASLA